MELNAKMLQKSLLVLRNDYGLTYVEITENSNVHNIARIIKGAITPTAESWWKLHEAYPHVIPQPSFTDGERVYQSSTHNEVTGDNSTVSAGNMHITNRGVKLNASQEYLVELINKIENGEEFTQSLIFQAIQKINELNTQK